MFKVTENPRRPFTFTHEANSPWI